MSIFRGPGGSGDATNDATVTAVQAAATAAASSATNAANSATAAATSASGAATSATNAANSATTAAGSVATAAGHATNASTFATNASLSADDAADSATEAEGYASQANDSEVAASASASAAATSEAAALAAQAAAETAYDDTLAIFGDATDVANAVAAAQLAETNAETAETNAETAATTATNAASTATTQATNAAASALAADADATAASIDANEAQAAAIAAQAAVNSATSIFGSIEDIQQAEANSEANRDAAAASATSASNSESTATTQAGIATTQANAAAASAAAASAVVLSNEPVRPTVRPSLLLDFANTKQLDPRITFSRPTTARYYDEKSTVKAEENLVTRSQEFSSAWSTSFTTVTVDSTTAPDGTTTADSLIETSAANFHILSRGANSISSSGLTTFSCFAKASTRTAVVLQINEGANRYAALFNLSTGAFVSTNTTGSPTSVSNSITSVGNGWYRCTVTCNVATTCDVIIALSNSTTPTWTSSVPTYTGDGTSGVFIWGAQVEQRSAVTAYTATTTAPITNYIPVLLTQQANESRFDHNPVTRESLGLLIEEQRTNFTLRSSELTNASWSKSNSTIDGNVTIAPDGTQTVQLFTATTTAASCFQQISLGAGDYSMSVYLKRGNTAVVALGIVNVLDAITYNFDTGAVGGLSAGQTRVTSVGNGWVRIEFWRNCSAGTFGPSIKIGTAGGTVFVWGVQFELGQFATSYIPTVASQVTRSADSASMTGANFSSWYNNAEGTAYIEGTQGYAFEVHQGAASDYRNFWVIGDISNTGTDRYIAGNNNSATQWDSRVFSTKGVKMAFGYKTNDIAGYFNGTQQFTDNAAIVPTNVDSAYFNFLRTGTIKKFAYYPARVTNAQLQGVTTV